MAKIRQLEQKVTRRNWDSDFGLRNAEFEKSGLREEAETRPRSFVNRARYLLAPFPGAFFWGTWPDKPNLVSAASYGPKGQESIAQGLPGFIRPKSNGPEAPLDTARIGSLS
jgi:hypothetical protein